MHILLYNAYKLQHTQFLMPVFPPPNDWHHICSSLISALCFVWHHLLILNPSFDSLSFNFCSWYVLVQKQEEWLLFVQVLVVLNYKFLCSIYTAEKYLHVVHFLLKILTSFFKLYRCASKSIFAMEAERIKTNPSSFLILCRRMKNSNYNVGLNWNTELSLI